jgi:hypothetical protein
MPSPPCPPYHPVLAHGSSLVDIPSYQ